MSDSKRYGVRLTLPGAPNTDTLIPGLHVNVRPDTVTPLDTPEDVDRARRLIEDGAHIEIVELGTSEARKPADPVSEPLDGYDDLTAQQVKDRLETATADEARRIADYEQQRDKPRTSVLDAAQNRINNADQEG